MSKYEGHTPGPWLTGWMSGKSGPTTPAIDSPICGGKKYPYTLVGYGRETYAIIPAPVTTPNGQKPDEIAMEANAHLIADAPMLAEQNAKMLAFIQRLHFEGDLTVLERDYAKALIAEIEGKP